MTRASPFSCIIMAVVCSPLAFWLGWDVLPRWGLIEWRLIAASGPLISSFVAVAVFGERLSALGVAGIVGVVAGVFLIADGPGLFKAVHDPARRERVLFGVFLGLLTGTLIAAYTCWMCRR